MRNVVDTMLEYGSKDLQLKPVLEMTLVLIIKDPQVTLW